METQSTSSVQTNKGIIFLNTVLWGIALWLFGYILGFIFFAFVPKDMIGWFVMPLGLIATIWVLLKKINRESFGCYVGLAVMWTILAVILDYVFLVKMLGATDYYKVDIYLYYISTFVLPIIVGWYKFKKMKSVTV
jgi:hypothetical protein